MYEHERRRGLFFLHVHNRMSPTLGLFSLRQLDNFVDTVKLVEGENVFYTKCQEVSRMLKKSGNKSDEGVLEAVG